MLWLAGLFFLALRFVAKKFAHKHRVLKLVPFAFLALAVAAMAYAPLPFGLGSIASLAAALAGWVFGIVGGWIGVSSSVIAGLVLVLVLLFGAIDLIKDLKPDGWATAMVYALPVLVLIAAGPVAAQIQDAITTLGGVGPEVVANVTG